LRDFSACKDILSDQLRPFLDADQFYWPSALQPRNTNVHRTRGVMADKQANEIKALPEMAANPRREAAMISIDRDRQILLRHADNLDCEADAIERSEE